MYFFPPFDKAKQLVDTGIYPHPKKKSGIYESRSRDCLEASFCVFLFVILSDRFVMTRSFIPFFLSLV